MIWENSTGTSHRGLLSKVDNLTKYKEAVRLGYSPSLVDITIMRNADRLLLDSVTKMTMNQVVVFFETSCLISDIWLNWAVENGD